MGEAAKVLASKILRTNVFHRPHPALFYFPGLTQKPFHNASNFSFTKDFENNLETIKEEYKELKEVYGE